MFNGNLSQRRKIHLLIILLNNCRTKFCFLTLLLKDKFIVYLRSKNDFIKLMSLRVLSKKVIKNIRHLSKGKRYPD